MQHPTCTNIRIRSVHDAHKIFYAVQQGLLQMVTRRLDADERTQLRTGCVYAWEERGPHTELTGLGIERFTEGRRWSPSRVRDEFLFYYEKYSPSPDCANPHPPRDWDPLVKQTYSVWVETDKGKRKWHLTAYFTQATVDQLSSIDDVRVVRDLVVPEGMFKSTRVTKTRNKNDENRPGESSKSSSTSAAGISRYAPFPAPTLPNPPEVSDQVLMYQPYANHDASAPHEQHQIRSDPPVQQYPTTRASNPNAVHANGFRDQNQYPSQTYRPLLPSSHPRPPADSHDLAQYGSGSQQIPVKFRATDIQPSSATLAQVRLESERLPSPSQPSPSIQTPADGPPASTSHSSVNAMQSYPPNTQTFPAVASSAWTPGDAGVLGPSHPSIYYGNRAGAVPASAAAQSNSYPPSHSEINTDTNMQPYRPIQFLNPPVGDLAGGSNVSREPLPSLSILQETYSFSYDFSVSMVSSGGAASTSGSIVNVPSSTSAPSSSQKSRISGPGSSKSGGPCRDLDLAPLNSLARSHPYRREPMDDRALRLLGPRST
ncbi:hypothetical protein P691DRAFT_794164 [Macrolepiota fuliginosa MF-IS2]|uniref:cAMP-independent regulatory protein pac2 n=1 Tax=Macrolepiota fuliginosa MF-IS2 TaxID=1400762 RepID=A0A9P5XL63_9AGAR|nr:hypothetical protein P691DRAFT_794164 [Macrolepiota fuliginosa MF-IS2]